jgi:WD40 repeat protein
MFKRAVGWLCVAVILLSIGIGSGMAQGGEGTPITLNNAYRLQQQAILGHGAADRAAWSPDGAHLAVGSSAGIWLYNSADFTASPHLLETPSGSLIDLVYSPDGTRLAATFAPDTLAIWDGVTGARLPGVDDSSIYAPTHLAFSPDSQTLAIYASKRVKMWDLQTGTWTGEFESGSAAGIAVNPATGEIAAISNQVTLWNPATGASRTIRDVSGTAITYSPDGALLAVSREDGTLQVVDSQTGTERFSVPAHAGPINQVTFSPDGTNLVTASEDGSLRLWDSATGELRHALEDSWGAVRSAAFSPDGRRLASVSEGVVRLWTPNTGDITHTFDGFSPYGLLSVAFSPDGTLIAGGDTGGTITLWKREGTVVRVLYGHLNHVVGLAFSPDGTLLASGGADNTIRLWDVASGDIRQVLLTGNPSTFYDLAFDPTGAFLAAATSSSEIQLWEMITGTLRHEFYGHADAATTVAFSPDGKRLASGSIDGTVQLWNMADYTHLTTLTGHTEPVAEVAFNVAGDRLASASVDDSVRIWAIPDSTPLIAFGTNVGYSWLAVKYTADGSALASAGQGGLVLWNPDTGVTLADFTIPGEVIQGIAINTAGDTLATAESRGVVRLWGIAPSQDALAVGRRASIHVTGDETLNFRDMPGIGGTVQGVLSNGTPVTVLEGPQAADNYVWWRVETPSGARGWVVESADGVQTLVP